MPSHDSRQADSLLDIALEVIASGQPVQLRVTDQEGKSEYVVGHIASAYEGRSTNTIVLRVGDNTLRLEPAHEWEMVVHEEPRGTLIMPEVLTPEPARPEWVTDGDPVLIVPDNAIVVHALRWHEGTAVGHHEAIVLRRWSADAWIVQYTLDGYRSMAVGYNIRATPADTVRLQEMKVKADRADN